MGLPVPSVVSGSKDRLAIYLNKYDEKISDIAAFGPANLGGNGLDYNSFIALCAYALIEADPDDGFAYLTYAKALYFLGQIEDALSTLRELDNTGLIFLGYYDDPYFIRRHFARQAFKTFVVKRKGGLKFPHFVIYSAYVVSDFV